MAFLGCMWQAGFSRDQMKMPLELEYSMYGWWAHQMLCQILVLEEYS